MSADAARCECGNLATVDGMCEWCAAGECEVLVTVIGAGTGEIVGTCPADGMPIYRSRMAGTIYHASNDEPNTNGEDDGE